MESFEKRYQRLHRQLLISILGIVGVFLLGTLWFRLVERWSWIDSAYMTVITLSTVGFTEVQPLGDRSRLFMMVLIIMGIITFGYIVNLLTEGLSQGYFQKGMQQEQQKRLIDRLSGHYILCGYGRMGHQIALEFDAEGIPFVIVDSDPEKIAEVEEHGYIFFLGDATLDECLLAVGIERAVCLVTALQSDAENLYTILSAKTLNPQIRAIARANNREAIQKLKRAGADAVVSPYVTGGRRLAAAALRPQVMDFVDGIITGKNRSLYMDEFVLDHKFCPYIGQTLQEVNIRANTGVLILAIRRQDGTLIGGPTGDTKFEDGDLLICMGTAEQLHDLNRLLGPVSSYQFRPLGNS